MGIIISIKDTRVDRIFRHPVTSKQYQKTFNFTAGVPLKTETDAEEAYGQALANTYPDNYFTSKAEYEKYLKALAEEAKGEPSIPVVEAGTEEDEPVKDEDDTLPEKKELLAKEIDELREIATELEIDFAPNIGKEKLVDRIISRIAEAQKEE